MNTTVLLLSLSSILAWTSVTSARALQIKSSPPQASTSNTAQKTQKLAAIRGKVLAAESGMGLSKASVVLSMLEVRQVLTAITNPQGEYEFKELKLGKYSLMAMHNGYVRRFYGQKSAGGRIRGEVAEPLQVRAGETLDGIDFSLSRGGVVEGRIVDQDNEPLPGVNVQLVRYGTFQGERRLFDVGFTTTDDRGQYRIFEVPPGSYYLTAAIAYLAPRVGGRPESAYLRTYYPGVSSPQEAAKIPVSSGGEVQGIDFTMIAATGYTISGRVFRADGKPASQGVVSIQRVDGNDMMGYSYLGSGSGDRFKISNLPPGHYRLKAANNPEGNQFTATTLVDLGTEDVEGITLVLGSGAEISGRIVIDSDVVGALQSKQIQISLMLGDGRQPIEVREDLTFTISDVKEGTYRFMLNFPADNSYVKSIRGQGQELLDQPFELRNNQRLAGVEVLISTQGGQLWGVAKQSDNADFAKDATVVLFSTDKAKRANMRFTKIASTDERGRFSLKGIVPGEYSICALLNHESGSESDPAYLSEIEKSAKRVLFENGSTLNESLTVSPAPVLE